MFYVLDAIEMAVDVYVAVLRLASGYLLQGAWLYAPGLLDGAGWGVANVVVEVVAVECGQVDGFACFYVNHCPNGARVAQGFSVVGQDSEVAACEEAKYALYPRLYCVALVAMGALLHFDDEARQHPSAGLGGQGGDAEIALFAVVVGGVQQLIAYYGERHLVAEVHLKGCGLK